MSEKLKILVADDAKFVREHIKLILEQFYIVETASSFQDTIKKIQISQKHLNFYDLILIDNYLPEPDAGLKVLEFIKENNIDIIAVMISGHTEIESEPFKTAINAFKAGAVDFLTKPFTKNLLLNKIENLITKKKQAYAVMDIAREMSIDQYKEELNKILNDDEVDMITKDKARKLLLNNQNSNDINDAFLKEPKEIEVSASKNKSHKSMWHTHILKMQDIPEEVQNKIFKVIACHKQVYKIKFGSVRNTGPKSEYKLKIKTPIENSGIMQCTLFGPSSSGCTGQDFNIFVERGSENKIKFDLEKKLGTACV